MRPPAGWPSTPGRNRTCDLRFRKPSLYPLSYEGKCFDNPRLRPVANYPFYRFDTRFDTRVDLHATPPDAGGRGSDLAVTAGELNAGTEGERLGCTPVGISGKNPQRQLSFTPGHRYDAWARWFGEIGHSTNWGNYVTPVALLRVCLHVSRDLLAECRSVESQRQFSGQPEDSSTDQEQFSDIGSSCDRGRKEVPRLESHQDQADQ